MNKVIIVEEADEVYSFLLKSKIKEHRSIANAITRDVGLLRVNFRVGQQIRRILIPNYYKKRYFASTLFRIGLPCYWRLLYTVVGTPEGLSIYILSIIDHKEYDRKFGY